MKLIVSTFKSEQRKNGKSAYNFKRTTNRPTDTAASSGSGTPVKPVGLICSVFRPSDDGPAFPFLIPSNYFAVQSLRQLAEILGTVLNEKDFAKECLDLATEVQSALKSMPSSSIKKRGKYWLTRLTVLERNI